MKLIENEQILWESKNKQQLLTTHRLREMNKSFLGSSIKSIMLEELTYCELRTIRQFGFLRKAVLWFLLINGSIFLLNHYLFNAELIKWLFGEVHIGQDSVQMVFNVSILVAVIYCALFVFSIKKVFSFHANNRSIDFQLRWVDFEERESFISKVEEAKDKRGKR